MNVIAMNFLLEFWEQLPSVPEPFKTILIGGFGALIGTGINGYTSARRKFIEEQRLLSVAQILCFVIFDRTLYLKSELIKPLKNRYDNSYNEYLQYKIGFKRGELEINFDYQAIPTVHLPFKYLESIVYEKLFIGAEGISATTSLTASVYDLLNSIEERSKLCIEMQNTANISEEEKISRYFGLFQEGLIDQRFEDNINALYLQIDNCIFFSRHLEKIIVKFEGKRWIKK